METITLSGGELGGTDVQDDTWTAESERDFIAGDVTWTYRRISLTQAVLTRYTDPG